jgi:hypothetical protein
MSVMARGHRAGIAPAILLHFPLPWGADAQDRLSDRDAVSEVELSVGGAAFLEYPKKHHSLT